MNGTIHNTAEIRRGIVTAISPGALHVRVKQESACTQCHARQFCTSTDCKDRDLDLRVDSGHWRVGDEVLVIARAGIGRRAVLLAFVLPLVLLLTALSLSQTLGSSPEVGILITLLVLALYYLALYSQRHRLAGSLILEVRPAPAADNH